MLFLDMLRLNGQLREKERERERERERTREGERGRESNQITCLYFLAEKILSDSESGLN